jgi:hypothetical protein
MYTEKEKQWLLTEGNQFVVVGEFVEDKQGHVHFSSHADSEQGREDIPVPVWAILNMLAAYARPAQENPCQNSSV